MMHLRLPVPRSAAPMCVSATLAPGWSREGAEWFAELTRTIAAGRSDQRDQWEMGDFATGDRGADLVSLAAYLFKLSQADAAVKVADMIGSSHMSRPDPFAPLSGTTAARRRAKLGRLSCRCSRCAGLPAEHFVGKPGGVERHRRRPRRVTICRGSIPLAGISNFGL